MNEFFIFHEAINDNNARRSRTVQTKVGHTGVSPLKLRLLKSGEELEAQLAKNTLEATELAWKSAAIPMEKLDFKQMFLEWIAALNAGTVDVEGYRKLRQNHSELSRVGDYYRLWEIAYDPRNPRPTEIEFCLKEFIAQLPTRMKRIEQSGIHIDRIALAALLAYADHEIDRIIHPWVDGCGRFATLLVMWLALRIDGVRSLPKFGAQEEHYAAIAEYHTHQEYMRRCLRQTSHA